MRNFGHNSRSFVQGLSWTVILRFVVRGVAVVRSVALARLLDPAGFGVFGIAIMVLALFGADDRNRNKYFLFTKS